MPRYRYLKVARLSAAIGAVISGVHAQEALDDDVINEIKDAWHRYLVLIFEEQDLSCEQHIAFARSLGKITQYPMSKGLVEYPEIVPVIKLAHERQNFGGVWHSDTTYLPSPPSGTLLLARELPPIGGDTKFANMYLAYEQLSNGMKRIVNSLNVIQSSAKRRVMKGRGETVQVGRRAGEEELIAEHPVVRIHSETGRRALYVNQAHSLHFSGMNVQESQPLLNYLFRHQTSGEFTARYRWRPGTMILWDNRCVQHYPLNDYHGYKRVMHRITIA